MANKFARSNGNFDGPIWALTSGGVAGSTTAPTIGDNASANTFTVQITGNVACDNIANGNAYGGNLGGTFSVLSSCVISANITAAGGAPFPASGATCTIGGSSNVTINGNLQGNGTGGPCHGVLFTSSGTLNIFGNCNGFVGGAHGLRNNSSNGSVVVTGNSVGSGSGFSPAAGILNSSSGSTTIYGNVVGVDAFGLSNTSTGPVTVYGNLNGSTASALSNTSTGPVTVVGNVIGDSRGGAGITSSNAAANVKISGNLIGAPNGIPAVYAASYTVNPVPYQTYIRYANNGTGVGSDAYLYHYTTDSLSAFSIPPVSAVRAGLQYANNTLTGTCEIPAASAVTFGVLVDNTSGTAALTSNSLFDVSVASLTATDSLGAKLRNSATVESIGRIIASFSN